MSKIVASLLKELLRNVDNKYFTISLTVLGAVFLLVLVVWVIQYSLSHKIPFYGRITGVNVNVRANPSKKAKVVYQFENTPEALIVTGSSKGSDGVWYNIRAIVPMLNESEEEYETEIKGWVFGKYVTYERNYDSAYD